MKSILLIGFAKQTLREDSVEYKRMKEYAEGLECLTLIVFTRRKDKLPAELHTQNVRIIGTNSRTRVGAVYRAIILALRVSKEKERKWIISGQDAFVAGLVAYVVSVIRKLRFVVQIHGDPFAMEPTLLHNVRLTVLRFLVQRSDSVRVVSKRVNKQLVTDGVPAEKIITLPIAPSLESFLRVGQDRSYEPGNALTLLFVGRLAPEKNLLPLLKAFHALHKKYAHTRLRIIGNGPEYRTLEEYTDRNGLSGNVEIKPWTDDVSAEMKDADIFVLASKHEGYALVLIEAMAAGLPIVTTDVGCVGDIVLDKEHALVAGAVDSHYVQLLEELVVSADIRKKLGTAGHVHADALARVQTDYLKRWRDSF